MTILRPRLNVNSDEVELLTGTPTPPTTQPDEAEEIFKAVRNHENRDIYISIHVTRNPANRNIQLRSNHPLPTMNALRPFMSDRNAARVTDYGVGNYTVDQVCNSGYWRYSPADWQDLLVKELTARICGANDDPPPYEADPFSSPAYMIVGGTLYRLQPEEQVKTTGALKGLRKRITAEATAQAKTIIARAQQYERDKTTEADKKLAAAKKQLDNIKKSGKLMPPQWALDSDIATRYNRTALIWYVQLHITIHFTHLYFKWEEIKQTGTPAEVVWQWKKWHSKPHDPIQVEVWVPITNVITGEYTMSGIFVGRLFSQLPHISYEQACMAPATAPKVITNFDQLNELRLAIERCLQVIDYSSPLVKAFYWNECIRKAWPSPLMAALTDREYWTSKLKALAADESGTFDIHKDSSETWSAA